MNMNIYIIVVDISIVNDVLYLTIYFHVQVNCNFLFRCIVMKDKIFLSLCLFLLLPLRSRTRLVKDVTLKQRCSSNSPTGVAVG